MEEIKNTERKPAEGFDRIYLTNVPMQDILDLQRISTKTGTPIVSLIRPKIKEVIKENERYLR